MIFSIRILNFSFLLAVLMMGCEKNEPDWIRINNTFFLSLEEEIKVIDSKGNTLLVMVTEINDSRCPADAVCVRKGEAIVKVVIEDTRNSQYKTLLCIGECSPSLLELQAFTFYGKEYVIKLLEVDPFPDSSNQGEPEKAGLKIYEN